MSPFTDRPLNVEILSWLIGNKLCHLRSIAGKCNMQFKLIHNIWQSDRIVVFVFWLRLGAKEVIIFMHCPRSVQVCPELSKNSSAGHSCRVLCIPKLFWVAKTAKPKPKIQYRNTSQHSFCDTKMILEYYKLKSILRAYSEHALRIH